MFYVIHALDVSIIWKREKKDIKFKEILHVPSSVGVKLAFWPVHAPCSLG
jgi:hypothetical protein